MPGSGAQLAVEGCRRSDRAARSERQAGGVGAGPGPLEVEAAQLAGDVQHLADEEQARHRLGLEGLGGHRVRVQAAQGHLGGFPNTSQKVVKNGRIANIRMAG